LTFIGEGILAAQFGIFGAICLAAMSVLSSLEALKPAAIAQQAAIAQAGREAPAVLVAPAAKSDKRKCPECGERIKSKETVCRYCGTEQPEMPL
jgi:predicted RNA-binding Zn-ribbon protein involved in translation (DUF1610 family)